MSDTSYWCKQTGRGGEIEEFATFAEAKQYYFDSCREDSEDMDILLSEDGIVIAAWEYDGKAWRNTDKYTDQPIDDW
jgi:hypothetical protein